MQGQMHVLFRTFHFFKFLCTWGTYYTHIYDKEWAQVLQRGINIFSTTDPSLL
mgnify:CR=1 FL=1